MRGVTWRWNEKEGAIGPGQLVLVARGTYVAAEAQGSEKRGI